jgi:hypothetical protein
MARARPICRKPGAALNHNNRRPSAGGERRWTACDGRRPAKAARGERESVEYFLQQLINAVALGSIYGLIALGYTMVYGIIGMINFAHGDIFMVGAFIALIAFLALVAIGLTAVPLALFLVLLSRWR